MQIDLTGRVAIVTGATGQLGRTMARTLAECGADIAIHFHKNREKGEELEAEIAALGRRTVLVQADITDETSVFALRDKVIIALGAADIVVTNAVSQYPWKSILEQPVTDFDNQYESCVRQNVLMAKAFVPTMIERGWGRIVGINTECAMQCFSGQAAYVAAKRGMDGVLRVLAQEVGSHGITVNQVAPGWTISDRDREAHTERNEGYEKSVPLRRRGTDQEIANAVAFLASDLAGFITGVYLPVCGGNVMPRI